MTLQEFREACLSMNLIAVDESCFKVNVLTKPTFRLISEELVEVTYEDEKDEKVISKLHVRSVSEFLNLVHQMMSVILKVLGEEQE